ncbi:NADPH:quinone oxidoreductase [Sorangium cellulosum]|uniref:NADPH:quinone oxidoreductase n=1 Tax=Sorangium cellulosum TaxID=56 RepID=A0A150PIX2_SORCE|nr:NADPH:quinone oxidoreductase [Sorangium cellulosum]
MRAARRERYGTPSVIRIEDVAVPTPADDEILVRVHAATVSRTDCALLSASPFILRFMTGLRRPKSKALGTDFAGRVEAIGSRVRSFAVGDDVWGINDLGAGSHAEYLVISGDDSVARMPTGLSFEEAAASIEGAWYAYSITQRAALEKDRRVLINGATGAIGSALLQICVSLGANVTAVGNTKNLELLRSLGAARVIDYEQEDFTRDDQVYDYVFDAVGKSTFGACKRLLTPRGVYVSSEPGPGWQNPFLALLTPALGRQRVVFPIPIDRKAFLDVIGRLVTEGHFRPVIDRAVSLDAVQEAYAYAASGQKTGSVVLKLAA